MAAAQLVVAAVDGSADSEAAVAWVARNTAAGRPLHILFCQPQKQSAYSAAVAQHGALPTAELAQRFPQAQRVEVIATPDGTSEGIADAILRRAAELRAALLAIAPHDRTATERVLHGSVTDVLVRRARLPILVVRGI